MMTSAPRLFRIFGIDIRVHPSWLVVFALVTWSLAVAYFPESVPGSDGPTAWVLGAIASLLFFGSVLLHELSHSLVARRRGIGVHSITLFIFGGVSSLTGDAATAGSEFVVAIVGPLTSLVIAGIGLGGAALVDGLSGGSLPLVSAVLGYLGLVNGLVGLFNLVPGFPLDGGRVLRSILWRATGNMPRATRIAALVGRVVAYLFMLWGLLRILSGDVVGGIWMAAIGWFLDSAAASSVTQLSVEDAVRGVRVRDVVRPGSVWLRPDQSVEDAIRWTLLPYNLQSAAVVDGPSASVVGILNIDDVRRVPPDRREQTPVADVMRRSESLATISPDASLRDALAVLASSESEEVPVVENGRLVGLLSRAEIMRAIQLREELGRAA